MKTAATPLRQYQPFQHGIALVFLLLLRSFGAAAEKPKTVPVKSATAITLAESGKALQPIVISAAATEPTKAVAAELAGYLGRMTGGQFEVKTGDGRSGIVLGTLQEFPAPDLEKPLALRGAFDGREAFVIRSEKDRLLLIGRTEMGVSHAAFRLLETLGCRWFFPNPAWEIVPTKSTLRVTLNEADRPAVLARRHWGMVADGFWKVQPAGVRSPLPDWLAWRRHNRMEASFQPSTMHAYETYMAYHPKVFDEHPEYLALVGGKRIRTQFCLSNKGLQQQVVDWSLEAFAKDPKLDMVSVEPSDGGNHCECDECKKLGSISNRVFGLANIVARAVQAKYPGKMVGVLAYNLHSSPPDFSMEPNVFIQPTVGFSTSNMTFDELMAAWSKKCRQMGTYEYYTGGGYYNQLPPGRADDMAYIKRTIPGFASKGVISMDWEAHNDWGLHGRGFYLGNKLMWNPKANGDAILKDFYDKAFGPAAAPVQRFYERFDPGAKPFITTELYALLFRDLDEASNLAKDRPDVLGRLDQLKQFLTHQYFFWAYDHETEKGGEARRKLALRILSHAYRTRYSYLISYADVHQYFSQAIAIEFKEPSWSIYAAGDKPWWKDNSPLTHEETEANFQEGLKYFQPQNVAAVKFSDDLVPIAFPDSKPDGMRQNAQWAPRYGFYSMTGEPLKLRMLYGYANHPEVPGIHYKLTPGAGGKPVVDEWVKSDAKQHDLELKVPKAGLYWFDIETNKLGTYIDTLQEQRFVMVAPHDDLWLGGSVQPWYFYVPKGTKRIQYYFHSGLYHKVYGPKDQLIKEVNSYHDSEVVDVPEGLDGTVWSLRGMANVGGLYFTNVPNVIAASANSLLVPRELAIKDKLTTATK